MTQRDWVVWLPSALLLLGVPGCMMLRGSHTIGIVGESLSVQCPYEKKYEENDKYWCRGSTFALCDKIVETRGSEKEKRNGRVSIRDHPAWLYFTVNVTNLTVEDADVYWCGIDKMWLDDSIQVVVSVSPAPKSSTPTRTRTSTTTTEDPPVPSTVLITTGATHSTSLRKFYQSQSSSGLSVLLAFLVALLLLLVGASLMVWRMVRRRAKAAENTELPLKPSQPWPQLQHFELSEPCYANLELQTGLSRRTPEELHDTEVEYSTVAAPVPEVHYSSVTFVHQNQDAEATSAAPERTQEELEYSVVKKTHKPAS